MAANQPRNESCEGYGMMQLPTWDEMYRLGALGSLQSAEKPTYIQASDRREVRSQGKRDSRLSLCDV